MRSRSTETSSPERARQHALRLLTGRDYTAAALRAKLRSAGFGEEDLDAALARLEAAGLIDDRRYAERFAESALASGRFFGGRLRQELRRRGVDDELAAEVIASAVQGYDEDGELRALLEKRFPEFSSAGSDEREKRRVLGFLQRRGFGFSAIMRAMKEEAQ